VNLAARLVAQADAGTVVAPASTAHDAAALGAFSAEELGEIRVRGFSAPIPIAAIHVRR
jgi:class 3 adenylate cyclase